MIIALPGVAEGAGVAPTVWNIWTHSTQYHFMYSIYSIHAYTMHQLLKVKSVSNNDKQALSVSFVLSYRPTSTTVYYCNYNQFI